MTRTVYINGDYLPENEAKISIFDRGFLMADSVYEVSAVIDGKLADNAAHLRRLERSLHELAMPLPLPLAEIVAVQKRLIAANNLQEGTVYLHVTRGEADRDFLYDPNLRTNLVMFTQARAIINSPAAEKGLRVMTQADIRWARRDIKTTQLLAQSLAKMTAVAAGYDDTWMIDNAGNITEGSSNNAWIRSGQTLITRPPTHNILNGITRQAAIALLGAFGMTLEERPFRVEEAHHADEAFLSAAGSFILPVVEIDGHRIGDGTPGAFTQKLRERYIAYLRETAA